MRESEPTDPIDALYTEHDHALEQLGILERSSGDLAERGVSPGALSDLERAVAFLDGEIRCHNQWEEDHLFPLLEARMGPAGPCAVMRHEHRELWDAYAELIPLVEAARSRVADPDGMARLRRVAGAIVGLLTAHIAKENEILFPMARRLLSVADVAALRAVRPAA